MDYVDFELPSVTHHPHHQHGPQAHHHDIHGNPDDLREYVERLEAADRDAWQRPDEVLRALTLTPGMWVAELGPGSGYFTRRIARAVAPGHVFAVDVEATLLATLHQRLEAEHLTNVSPILGRPDEPCLPPGCCDRVVTVNTLHHVPRPDAMLRRLAGALKPNGLLACVDFHRRETPMGPPVELRLSRDDVVAAASRAGLRVADDVEVLEHQYLLLLGVA